MPNSQWYEGDLGWRNWKRLSQSHNRNSVTQFLGRYSLYWFPVSSSCKEHTASAGDVRDLGSIPGLGRSSGGGHSNTLQSSCLENPMDRGAWRATVHRVAQRQIWLRWLITHAVSLPPQAHTLSDTECNYFHERKNLEVNAVSSFYFLKEYFRFESKDIFDPDKAFCPYLVYPILCSEFYHNDIFKWKNWLILMDLQVKPYVRSRLMS